MPKQYTQRVNEQRDRPSWSGCGRSALLSLALWRAKSCTLRIEAPDSNALVMQLCRSRCGRTTTWLMPARRPSGLVMVPSPCRLRAPPSRRSRRFPHERPSAAASRARMTGTGIGIRTGAPSCSGTREPGVPGLSSGSPRRRWSALRRRAAPCTPVGRPRRSSARRCSGRQLRLKASAGLGGTGAAHSRRPLNCTQRSNDPATDQSADTMRGRLPDSPALRVVRPRRWAPWPKGYSTMGSLGEAPVVTLR